MTADALQSALACRTEAFKRFVFNLLPPVYYCYYYLLHCEGLLGHYKRGLTFEVKKEMCKNNAL